MQIDKKTGVLSCLLGLLAMAASAQVIPGPMAQKEAGCVLQEPVLLPGVETAEVFLFAIPSESLAAGREQTVSFSLLERDQLALRQSFLVSLETQAEDFVVFEALAEHPEERRMLQRYLSQRPDSYSIELSVDGKILARQTLTEFAAQSQDARMLPTLPIVAKSQLQYFSAGRAHKFEVCGDNFCAGGTFPNGEDCETCPQDCGSCSGICGNNFCGPNESCSTCSADCGVCPSCPTDLGEEERTELLSITSLGWSCLQDIYYPFNNMYFDRSRLNYKRYRVNRVRECNGSITETVVPGSTTYFSTYCFRRTYVSCFGGFGWPGCVF